MVGRQEWTDATGVAPQQPQPMAEGRLSVDLLLPVGAHTGRATVHLSRGGEVLYEFPRVLRAIPGSLIETDGGAAPGNPDDVATRQRPAVDADRWFAVRHVCSFNILDVLGLPVSG